MTWREFQDWKFYEEIEPFGELRDDYRTALIVQTMVNLMRDSKTKPYPIEDFLLTFGNEKPKPKPKQTWQDQKMMAQVLVEAINKATKKGVTL